MRKAEQYRQYFADLAESDPKKAKKEAKQELIAMGLFSQDGKRKKPLFHGNEMEVIYVRKTTEFDNRVWRLFFDDNIHILENLRKQWISYVMLN